MRINIVLTPLLLLSVHYGRFVSTPGMMKTFRRIFYKYITYIVHQQYRNATLCILSVTYNDKTRTVIFNVTDFISTNNDAHT